MEERTTAMRRCASKPSRQRFYSLEGGPDMVRHSTFERLLNFRAFLTQPNRTVFLARGVESGVGCRDVASMSTPFKQQFTLEKRIEVSSKIKAKYPDRVPVGAPLRPAGSVLSHSEARLAGFFFFSLFLRVFLRSLLSALPSRPRRRLTRRSSWFPATLPSASSSTRFGST